MLTLIIITAGAIALGAFASADRPETPAQPAARALLEKRGFPADR